MIARLVIAAAGAIIITATLLLGMDAVTALFRNEGGERYFRITDILPKPPPGRPERPEAQARPPSRIEPDIASPDAGVTIEAPAAPATGSPPLRGPEIELPEPPDN
jgi:hypothetical protein